jgi:hypothetical protein
MKSWGLIERFWRAVSGETIDVACPACGAAAHVAVAFTGTTGQPVCERGCLLTSGQRDGLRRLAAQDAQDATAW